MKKFFTFNKKSLNINNLSSNLFFLNFYNFKNKSFSLFFNFFSYFFLFNTPYLFNNNFSYLYMYYLNNSKFLIKNIFSNFSFIYPLNNSHKSSNNLFFKNSNRFFFKNFLFNLKKKSFPKKLNFLKFVISFKFKNILLNNFFNLNTINSNLHPFFMLTFSTFHYKNIFIKKMKTRNLEIFKLNKSDWVSINLARLTRSSFKLDDSDIFYFNSIYKSLQNFNLIPIINSFNHNDLLLENNFFFINLMDYSSNFFFNNLYFWNAVSTYHYKLNNSSFYFFLKKLKSSSNPSSPINSFYHNRIFDKNSNFLNFNNFFYFNKTEVIVFFFFNSILFKYFFVSNKKNFNNLTKSFKNSLFSLVDSFFYSFNSNLLLNNLIPNSNFTFLIKKKMLKIFSYSKFSVTTTLWQYNTLLRFLEFCSGRKVCVKFFNFLSSTLTFSEKAQCLIWSQKVKYFRKVLGPRLFLNESLQIMFLALKLKDPFFLSNWMVSTMYKISFWKYKMFLRYLKYVLRYFFWVIFKDLNIKGIKFQLKGKISVAGNARTRTVFHNVGFTSHTTFNNKILYNLNLVRSFTGVMGLKLWIVF